MAPQSRGKKGDDIPAAAKEGTTSIKGFVGGLASGLTKVAVGQPFDIIKTRLQCSPLGTYRGPLDCLGQIAKREGLLSLYKGSSPPAVGWAFADSVLMGSLHTYRLTLSRWYGYGEGTGKRLPTHLHALAGLGAGATNSLVMTPIETLKSKLQMQTQRTTIHIPGRGRVETVKREFSGPIDCIMQTVRQQGVLGLWKTLPITMIFRANFAVMFGGYDFFQRQFEKLKGTKYELGSGISTFLSGGLAAEFFWLAALPADTVKNRMMADSLYNPRYPNIRTAFLSVWNERGPNASTLTRIRSFYKGCSVALLRAFPTNAAALFAFETAMHLMGAEKTTTK